MQPSATEIIVIRERIMTLTQRFIPSMMEETDWTRGRGSGSVFLVILTPKMTVGLCQVPLFVTPSTRGVCVVSRLTVDRCCPVTSAGPDRTHPSVVPTATGPLCPRIVSPVTNCQWKSESISISTSSVSCWEVSARSSWSRCRWSTGHKCGVPRTGRVLDFHCTWFGQ